MVCLCFYFEKIYAVKNSVAVCLEWEQLEKGGHWCSALSLLIWESSPLFGEVVQRQLMEMFSSMYIVQGVHWSLLFEEAVNVVGVIVKYYIVLVEVEVDCR